MKIGKRIACKDINLNNTLILKKDDMFKVEDTFNKNGLCKIGGMWYSTKVIRGKSKRVKKNEEFEEENI